KLAFLDVTGNLDDQKNLMSVGFFVDLLGFDKTADDPEDDGKLTLNEFGSILKHVDIDLGIEAHMDAHLSVGAGTQLPTLDLDLGLDWRNPIDGAAPTLPAPDRYDPFDVLEGVVPPEVHFNNISIDAGSFLDRVLGKVLGQLNQFNPIPPKLVTLL